VKPNRSRRPLRTLALVLGLALGGCGGSGVGSGGTGAPVSASSATVNGFGSIVADGSVYGSDLAVVREEIRPSQFEAATARLGQVVVLRHQAETGVDEASQVDVEPVLIGEVSTVDETGGTLTVRSQTVRVNEQPDSGPVTFFDGFNGLAGLSVGERVRVHGVLRWEGSGREVRASRIEKLAAAPVAERVVGVVSGLDTTGGALRFTLGGLSVDATGATVLGGTVAEGRRVAVWFTPGSDTVVGVRVLSLGEPGSASTPGRIGGVVGRLDTVAQTFELAGVPVRYAGALVTPPPTNPVFTLADGVYVQVRGSHLEDGSFLATQVHIRRRETPNFVEVELTGPVEAWSSLARFEVRATPVNAQSAQFTGCGNPANPSLGPGQQVRVEGGIQTAVSGSFVQATRVQCLASP
jgi:hypothetical protein